MPVLSCRSVCWVLLLPLLLGGCSGIAKGVTEAVLDHQDQAKEDARLCEIEGQAFEGVRQSLEKEGSLAAPQVTKVLMVHGINAHEPGYSNRFQKKLYAQLGLDVMDAEVKTIALDNPAIVWPARGAHELGSLRVSRHTDRDGRRTLVFYELTWSPMTQGQKKDLAGDTANNDGLARAGLNNSLKGFMNATVPDLLIYNGNGYAKITKAVGEAVCWMMGVDWQDLPAGGQQACGAWPKTTFAHLARDQHFFVTHSLGSRITIDTVQDFAAANENRAPRAPSFVARTVRDKDFTVFMLANQLPLLQMGRNPPKVANAWESYCAPRAPKADKRLMRRMNIVALSDPNDILSYPLPIDFATHEIDSRICPSITNVSLNVAAEKNLFDAVSFANPLTAHSGYMEDDRVISLIADGLGAGAPESLAAQRCRWVSYRSSSEIAEK